MNAPANLLLDPEVREVVGIEPVRQNLGPQTSPKAGFPLRFPNRTVVYVEFGGGRNLRRGATVNGVPISNIVAYATSAARRATVKELEPGYWYASADDFQGLWGDGESPKEALDDFEQSAVDWVELKLLDNDDDIPAIDGSPLNRQ